MSTLRLVISTLALLIVPTIVDAKDFMPWLENLAEAQQIAASRNQLVMVHFTADWCGPCQRIKKNVYSQRAFAHAVGQEFVPVRIDVGVQPQIAKQFSVSAWPTDLILTPQGQELHRMVSPQTETEYLAILRQIAWRRKSTPHGQVAQSSLPPMGNSPPSSSVTAPVANFLKGKLGRPSAPAIDPFATSGIDGYQRQHGGVQQPTQLTPQQQLAAQHQRTPHQPFTVPRQLHNQNVTAPNAQTPNAMASAGVATRPNAQVAGNAAQQIPAAVAQQRLQQAQFMQLQPPQTSAGTPGAPATTTGQAPMIEYDAASAVARSDMTSAAPNTGNMPDPGYVDNPMATFNQTMARAGGGTPAMTAGDSAPTTPTPSRAEPDPAMVAAYAKALEAARKHAEALSAEPETIYNEFVGKSSPANATQPAADPADAEPVTDDAKEQARIKIHVPTPAATASKQPNQPAKAEAIANSTPASDESSVRQVSLAPSQPSADASALKEQQRVQVAMDGFCPVSLLENNAWVHGDKQWGARHRGCVYLFNSAAAQQQFLADPDRFSPMLAGYDPVTFVEQQQYVTGIRKHGIRFQDRIVLFSSEDSLQAFSSNPDRYVAQVKQAMRAAQR